MEKIVIALGGNALQKAEGEAPTAENQIKNVEVACHYLSEIICKGYQVAITHGNGPQVGRIILQNEIAKDTTPVMPMDICGAMTQGMIGYIIQQSLRKKFRELNIKQEVVTIITQVVVDKNDQAFQYPSKPVGPFYNEDEAKKLKIEKGYNVKLDANRGWRRVVPSPIPVEIVELNVIKKLFLNNTVLITVGGGGVPVIKLENGDYKGVEAVIDKDYASGKLAKDIDADILLILTAVKEASINFGTKNEKKLHNIKINELKKFRDQGHFAAGSMLPKINTIIEFVESRKNRKAIITSLENAVEGLKEECGTIVKS